MTVDQCTSSCACCVDNVCKTQRECWPSILVLIAWLLGIILLFGLIFGIAICLQKSSSKKRRRRVGPSDSNENSNTPNQQISDDSSSNSLRESINRDMNDHVVKGVPEDNIPESIGLTPKPKYLYRVGSQEKIVMMPLERTTKEDLITDRVMLKPKDKSCIVIGKPQKRTDLKTTSQQAVSDEEIEEVSYLSNFSQDPLNKSRYMSENGDNQEKSAQELCEENCSNNR